MARFCGKCGTAANEKATFCNKCGNRLQQSKAIRFTHDTAATPQNPYSAEVDGGSGRRKGGAPIGVQPAVSKPGQKVTPPSPAAPPQASPAYASASFVTPSSYAPGSQTAQPPTFSDLDRPTFDSIDGDPVERARAIVRSFSAWSAGIVLTSFLLPFSDLVLLIPVQTAMILRVSRVFGVQDPPERILAYIAATSGVSVFGQVTTLIVANLFPFVGKFVSAPFVYGWTYGLGEVAIRYFESQGTLSGDEMKQVFKEANKEAYRSYKKSKPSVSQQESLDALKDHLSKDEYERLRTKFDKP
ncbi:MAG: hypothetical protein EB084_08000 [Proteobacteria bacterium]|nr:hypothetical protein [Pseudomonadota bacterium]